MNTDLYRLVFNPHRGMYIPSAECLPAGHGQGRSTRKGGRRPRLKALPLALYLAAALTTAPAALANPTGAQVIHGEALFNQTGPILDIHNSANAILNWQQFSIQPGETTRFIQPDASSAVLNRVIGPDPSQILGTLSSNGRVFLVNPAGILVGEGARIDVAGLVASTLPMSDADFLAGRLKFGDGLLGGTLDQRGRITTPEGGQVLLVGRNVQNAGQIHSPGGEVLLAAGETVEVLDSATPNVRVRITGVNDQLTHLGEIVADAGRIGLSGALVRNSGTLNASSAVNEGGRIFLRATRRIDLDETSRIAADGTRGGELSIRTEDADGRLAGQLIVRGELSAQGNGTPGTGGYIETSAARFDVRDVRVHTSGGEWLLDPYDISIQNTTDVNVSTGPNFESIENSAILSTFSIENALNAGTSVTVTTGTGGTQAGNITITNAIGKSGGGNATLTFNAHNDIYLNANISSQAGALNIVFNPDSDTNNSGKLIVSTTNVQIDANGGTITTNKNTAISNSSELKIGPINDSSALTTWNNSGSIELLGITGSGGGTINLVDGSTLNNSGSISIHYGSSSINGIIHGSSAFTSTPGTLGILVNSGTINSTPGTGNTVRISADFNNTGTVNVQSGTLITTKLPEGGIQNGTIHVSTDATYRHLGGLENRGVLSGTGTFIAQTEGDTPELQTITNAPTGTIRPATAGTTGQLTLQASNFVNQGTLEFDLNGANHDSLSLQFETIPWALNGTVKETLNKSPVEIIASSATTRPVHDPPS